MFKLVWLVAVSYSSPPVQSERMQTVYQLRCKYASISVFEIKVPLLSEFYLHYCCTYCFCYLVLLHVCVCILSLSCMSPRERLITSRTHRILNCFQCWTFLLVTMCNVYNMYTTFFLLYLLPSLFLNELRLSIGHTFHHHRRHHHQHHQHHHHHQHIWFPCITMCKI